MIRCRLFGHRLRVVQTFGPCIRRVKCRRCGGDWGVHCRLGAIVEWSHELEQRHRAVGDHILEPLERPGDRLLA